MELKEVDFVVPWVDFNNVKWRNSMEKHLKKNNASDMNGDFRFRSNTHLLKLWITGVIKNAKWVNTIWIVIDRESWVSEIENMHEKVRIVFHDQFIDPEWLPTYNSNAIETYIDQIEGLSEHFVLFNDDCFVMNPIEKGDFFCKNGLPLDSDVLHPIYPYSEYGHILFNNVKVLNDLCSFKGYILSLVLHKKRILNMRELRSLILAGLLGGYYGWREEHLPVAYTKQNFIDLYGDRPNIRKNNGKHKFRSISDTSHLLVRYYRLVNFNYTPRRFLKLGNYLELKNEKSLKNIQSESRKGTKILCINDCENSNAEWEKHSGRLMDFLMLWYDE